MPDLAPSSPLSRIYFDVGRNLFKYARTAHYWYLLEHGILYVSAWWLRERRVGPKWVIYAVNFKIFTFSGLKYIPRYCSG